MLSTTLTYVELWFYYENFRHYQYIQITWYNFNMTLK